MTDTKNASNLTFRTANGDDLDLVFGFFSDIQRQHAEAEPEFFRAPVKDDKFEEFFNFVLNAPDQHLVFACAGGQEIGYIQYFLGVSPQTIYQPERRIAHIGHLATSAAYRRSGCASKLIGYVKDEARRQNVAQIGLELWLFNGAAKACFEKAGFEMNQGSMWLALKSTAPGCLPAQI